MTVQIETRRKAKRLFIVEGKNHFNVSKITGVTLGTLRRWSSQEGWMASRTEYRQKQERIDLNLLNLYESITKKASESLDAQDIEMVLKLEKVLKKKEVFK
jgi:transposase